MKVFEVGRPACLDSRPVALAMGTFDGVHLGHQRLLGELVRSARRQGHQAGVMIPDPHPMSVVCPKSCPPLLTPMSRRQELICQLGVEWIGILPFTAEWVGLSPEEFVHEVISGFFQARMVFVGFNFTFGHRARGTSSTLSRLGSQLEFDVRVLEPVMVRSTPVSSSRIRALLLKGDLPGCRELLGRPFDIQGIVEKGDGRGRTMGIPTANLGLDPVQALPARGVYEARSQVGGTVVKSVVNVGRRPTFSPRGPERVEVHLLDYTGDLYGQTMSVHFSRRLRDERLFGNMDELRRQVEADIQLVRQSDFML